MQRERQGRDDYIYSGRPFDSFGGFGLHRSMLSSIFGGRDPFDDPFFSSPFGSVFGSSAPSSDPRQFGRTEGPVIEELNTDEEEKEEEVEGDETSTGENKDKTPKSTKANKDPLVEHPDDHADERESKIVPYGTDHNQVEGMQPQKQSASFRKVTYGGINGAYYTSTMTRRTGSNGVVLEESKRADRTTGQATHRISRGLHDKGHSVTRKLHSDGNVDTTQTLHNLKEDELAGFERTWKGTAEKHLPGWNEGFNFHGNAGASGSGQSRQATWGGLALPFIDHSGRAGRVGPDNEARNGRPKKVVTINIE